LLLVTALSFCGALAARPSSAAPDLLQTIKQRGTIVIGVRYDSPSFGWMNPATGNVEGFDVDLARYVAGKILGSPDKAVLKEAGTASRIAMLQQGDVDLLFTTMIVTPDRLAAIDMSNYYFPNPQTFMVLDTSTFSGNIQDIRGKMNCVPAGGYIEPLLLAVATPKFGITAADTSVMYLPGPAECVDALKTGRADFMFLSRAQEEGLARRTTGLKVLGDKFVVFSPWSAGVAKGNPQLLKAVNDAINAAYKDGTWAKLYKKWTLEDPPSGWRPGGAPGS
jgi:putative glutamine transport system substrate-binding protein